MEITQTPCFSMISFSHTFFILVTHSVTSDNEIEVKETVFLCFPIKYIYMSCPKGLQFSHWFKMTKRQRKKTNIKFLDAAFGASKGFPYFPVIVWPKDLVISRRTCVDMETSRLTPKG